VRPAAPAWHAAFPMRTRGAKRVTIESTFRLSASTNHPALPPEFMKLLVAFIAVLSFATLPAQCRIGETLDELVARFGEVKKDREATRMPGHDQFSFKMNGMVIECVMTDGKCVMEVFHRPGGMISNEDIKDLLKSEADGHTWGFNPKLKQWLRSDYTLKAYRAPGHADFFFLELAPAKKEGGQGLPGF
jgi:hypothetical protein